MAGPKLKPAEMARHLSPAALCRDPSADRKHPALTLPQAIPSHGANLNAVLYVASGFGPHPTTLLLHGLPGNEQNLDCAQAIRRMGWNVLTIHYRGSWGGPGRFSFANCLEDAAAALNWLQEHGKRTELRIDRQRIVVVGHSMGGFVAAHVASEHRSILGTALLSGVDLGEAFGGHNAEHASRAVDDSAGFSAGLHILAGTSREKLAAEARRNADLWRLSSYASRLADSPLLLVTADDGFASHSDRLADAVQSLRGTELTRQHFAADHSYSDCRIGLQSHLLRWLANTVGRRGPCLDGATLTDTIE